VDTTTPEGLYPIRTVSALTGVNAVTLRAWERRHGLIRPQRTAKGHRLYTEADIGRIHRILELLQQGIPIGQTRRLIDSATTPAAPGRAAGGSERERWDRLRQDLLDAVAGFDESALASTWTDALSLFPEDLVSAALVQPVLAQLRSEAAESAEHAAALHFFNAFVRNKLGARLHHRPGPSHGPRIIVAGLPGDPIDGELMLFTLNALAHGYRPLLLGPETPTAALVSAATRGGARAIAVSTASPLTERAWRDLAALAEAAAAPLFVIDSLPADHDRIQQAGAQPLTGDAEQQMAALYQRLGG
jgi:DNA-binding transcriptional MerR regulator